MMWLTWRQHRGELIVGVIVGLIFGLFLYVTGSFMYQGVTQDSAWRDLGGQVNDLLLPLLYPIRLLPLLLGVFVGAPLVAREFEQGTARLVWTQGITRRRWFYSKVLLLSAAVIVLFGALALGLIWWNRPVTPVIGPWLLFDNDGFVIIAQALFGLTLGIMLGALIGKTVPAMAVTIPLFVLVRLALVLLRPYYLPPEQVVWDFREGASPQAPYMLLVDMPMLDRDRNRLTAGQVSEACPMVLIDFRNPANGIAPLLNCYREHGFQQAVRYQPSERFWLFQGIESTIFLLLSAGLVLLAKRSLRMRLG